MDNFFVYVVTELADDLTVDVMALDEFDAEEQAQLMV